MATQGDSSARLICAMRRSGVVERGKDLAVVGPFYENRPAHCPHRIPHTGHDQLRTARWGGNMVPDPARIASKDYPDCRTSDGRRQTRNSTLALEEPRCPPCSSHAHVFPRVLSKMLAIAHRGQLRRSCPWYLQLLHCPAFSGTGHLRRSCPKTPQWLQVFDPVLLIGFPHYSYVRFGLLDRRGYPG